MYISESGDVDKEFISRYLLKTIFDLLILETSRRLVISNSFFTDWKFSTCISISNSRYVVHVQVLLYDKVGIPNAVLRDEKAC